MTETEYLRATNRVKVSAAFKIIQDVLPGDDLGITEEELKKIEELLGSAEEKLLASYELDVDEL